jgi:hypothetical protein
MAFSLQQWNLCHPQNVELCEDAIMTAAAGIQRYENRSGEIWDRSPPVVHLPVPLIGATSATGAGGGQK